jgi:NDP-sugar pyrophosphorylase family protein
VVGLHYRAELVIDHLASSRHTAEARVEETLTGPAGAVRLYGADPDLRALLVVSGDLLFDDDLGGLVEHHLAVGAAMTFATRRVRRASRFGVLDVGADGRVTGAREKPSVPDDEEYLVSAGIYCLSPSAVDVIPPDTTFDFAAHLAPHLVQRGAPVHTFSLHGYWSDVGTPEALRAANLDALQDMLTSRKDGGHTIRTDEGLTWVSEQAAVGADVTFRGYNALVGPVSVGDGATVTDSVLIGHGSVPARSALSGALAWSPEPRRGGGAR